MGNTVDILDKVLSSILEEIRSGKYGQPSESPEGDEKDPMAMEEGSPAEEAQESPEMEAKEDEGGGDEMSELQKYMQDNQKDSGLGKKKSVFAGGARPMGRFK